MQHVCRCHPVVRILVTGNNEGDAIVKLHPPWLSMLETIRHSISSSVSPPLRSSGLGGNIHPHAHQRRDQFESPTLQEHSPLLNFRAFLSNDGYGNFPHYP
jgi:hypothetical protein